MRRSDQAPPDWQQARALLRAEVGERIAPLRTLSARKRLEELGLFVSL
jgi:hypothetical protein